MENRFGQLLASSAAFRKVAIEEVWRQEARGVFGQSGATFRGFYVEEMLSYGKYANYNWVNSTVEANGPVDFFIGGLAVQTKSLAKIDPVANWSNMANHLRSGMTQLDLALANGIRVDNVDINFSNVRLDICIPHDMTQHVNAARLRIRQYIQDNIHNYPNLQQLGDLDFDIGTFDN